MSPKYLVGIDLGTTHTVVSYAEAQAKKPAIKLFEINQLTAPGEVSAQALLPSVRYHPAEGELSDADMVFTDANNNAVIGEAARFLGAKTQGRLVTSAKSWLSHPMVEHHADILPWGSENDIPKVSPIAASASYLSHVKTVWNQQFQDALLENQEIIVTVPASFDESARSLTLQACKMAGLPDIRLLEEPQAVFYDWLRRHQDNLKDALKDIHLLLVCDVGGGTTDLTLIKVEHHGDEPKLSRIAVGDHLMLGGDNVDLALAHLAEPRLAKKQKLSTADLSQLIEQCRQAKEILLADNAPETHKVTLLGGGSKLIGGARSTELNRQEVLAIALDGFFPLSAFDELPDKKRSGVIEFGLPYAAEPAISKHIAAFLQAHRQSAQQASHHSNGIPDALLLNGGVFASEVITQRALQLLNNWSEHSTRQLQNTHPNLAVAYGAVSYALARRGKQIKIGGGSARSYFLLLDTQADKQQAVCILPRGSEEGREIILKDREFALKLGQPVRFHLASLSGDNSYQAGDLAEVIDERFHNLPPLAVAFQQSEQADVIVNLSVTLTEVGTLQIQCVLVNDTTQRWDVEFHIRKQATSSDKTADNSPKIAQATEQIAQIFGSKSKDINPKAVKGLRADLEKKLGSREQWETGLLREIFGILLEHKKNRRRSANHERVWLSLAGYCLRPGFGFVLDDWRVSQTWNLYAQSLQFVNETQNWTEWWTLWRRLAGGLNAEAQQQLFKDISKFINPASARQGNVAKQGKQRAYDDMVRLAATLERLNVADKTLAGGWLLQRLRKASESRQSWWALGRIGSRIPFHGSTHNVIPATTAHDWLQEMLQQDWKKTPQIGFAATLISRKCGDRSRDIDDELRSLVIKKLKSSKAPSSWLEMVMTVKDLNEAEEKQIFGEALPPGLKLVSEA